MKKNLLFIIPISIALSATCSFAYAQDANSIAVLSSHFQNDHEAYEATSDAERGRMASIMAILKSEMGRSGRFKIIEVAPAIQARIDKDQKMGECGGCEIRYGVEIGTQQVAWFDVQKVSNLILNINVYVKDVESDKMIFMKSVDIRGNTDETWDHSMKYLLKNYMFAKK